MEEDWEEFEYGPRTDFGELRVTMHRDGRILFGAKTVKEMGDPPSVMLLFKRKERLIGVRPVHPRNPKAMHMRANSRDNYRLVSASRFCRQHGINLDRTMIFNTPVIEDGMLKLDLKAVTYIGRRGQAK